MAADSAGDTVTTVVTCTGDLSSSNFKGEFEVVLDQLEHLLGEPLTVCKLEPWNSVRVTLSIPREAALRLRQLANDGSQQLRSLGILSVQVEGDHVISLRLAGNSPTESQEVLLRTSPPDSSQSATSGSSASSDGITPLTNLNSTSSSSNSSSSNGAAATTSEGVPSTEKVQFRSPNVVCPPDSIVPKVPVPSVTNCSTLTVNNAKGCQLGPFPFTSMNQAVLSNRDGSTNITSSFPTPPPPYPNKHPPVTLSSPLLVNLLQSEGAPRGDDQTISNAPRLMPLQKSAASASKVTAPVHSAAATCSTTINNNINNNNNNKVVLPVKTLVNSNKSAAANNQLLSNAKTPVPYSNPYPPPYPNAANNSGSTHQKSTLNKWEQTVQPMPQLQELTATLTDFKDELDHLLPNLAASPPDLDILAATETKTVLLINPLTGEMEPQHGSESEEDGEVRDVFTGLPASPVHPSDDDTNSTSRPDTTDQSDSESRSGHSDSGKSTKVKTKSRDKGRESPGKQPTEKIKIRLKLEKSEPVSPVYKADVSFINMQQPKKAIAVASNAATVATGEELRVPPLHISLRGRNAVISNKKKIKINSDGVAIIKAKPKKILDHNKIKRERVLDGMSLEERKLVKIPKLMNDKLVALSESKELVFNNHMHYMDKLKERRGSDSELSRSNKKHPETNGTERRLSQSDDGYEPDTILGSTNIGTVASLANKLRKDKLKLKENYKSKEISRYKSYSKNLMEKAQSIALPTGDMDMEAKFKQRLLEDNIQMIMPQQDEKVVELIQTLQEKQAVKDKPPEPDKCNTPDRKPDLQECKQQPNRSPNSGAQGEDSGIESMDALSEKSPNQASQSPHADIVHTDTKNSKSQVPDILDIEAQLAKMEGIHGSEAEDLNENNHSGQSSKRSEQCCVLTSALQDSLNKGTVSLTQHSAQTKKEQLPQVEVSLVPIKTQKPSSKGEELDPLPLRVTPPLYTYSNSEKRGSETPTLSDSSDSNNLCNPIKKSLLEQLLIDIPDNQTPSSPSPATRSVRTRASSKLNSPELSSPVTAASAVSAANKVKAATPTTVKRKRHESDSSNNSLEEQRNKKSRKSSENAVEVIKGVVSTNKTAAAVNVVKKKVPEESSDSDEPLIEVAGKVKKGTACANSTGKVKVKTANAVTAAPTVGPVNSVNNSNSNKVPVNTRRSIRTMPVINTRSKGDKSSPDSETIRRKTRSAVSEGEGKRRKDIK